MIFWFSAVPVERGIGELQGAGVALVRYAAAAARCPRPIQSDPLYIGMTNAGQKKGSTAMVTSDTLTPQSESGNAMAEDGVVLLDGPGGLALALTADAAERTGQGLIGAATVARTLSPAVPEAEDE